MLTRKMTAQQLHLGCHVVFESSTSACCIRTSYSEENVFIKQTDVDEVELALETLAESASSKLDNRYERL